jgi:predicted TIM-barrel fold metal-dependent hydrolase
MMDVPLALRPSEYVRRQVRLTFLDDPVGASSLESLGADTFMWGSDFPHTDSTWPNSRAVIEKNLAGVPREIASRVVRENAAALYRIEL